MVTDVQQAAMGMVLFPAGIFAFAATTLFHIYAVISSVGQFDQYKEKKMLWVAIAMFFSFGFAIYYFVPKSRMKGLVVLSFGLLGLVCYITGTMLLPAKEPKFDISPTLLEEVKLTKPDPDRYLQIQQEYQKRFDDMIAEQEKTRRSMQDALNTQNKQAVEDQKRLQQEFENQIRQLIDQKIANPSQPQ
ncbi:hypothetical protein [Neisseria sp. Ec49-e6-T10]|uniref:hypothetical protein n=1 Tax=Neisseria sp. Ec49-e6-T10 TaxID=3140744 RepID=UPI003EBC8575